MHAGYAVSPASGSTTAANPTFSVYLNPDEQLGAEIYIASDTQTSSYFIAVHELGFSTPSVPTGAQGAFSCRPSVYLTGSYSSSLPPGTYYWWLTFYQGYTLQIAGPLVFTVPSPTPSAGAVLISPSDGTTVGQQPTPETIAPTGSELHFYTASSAGRYDDGTPEQPTGFSCDITVQTAGAYSCQNTNPYLLSPGSTYYWWVVITVG